MPGMGRNVGQTASEVIQVLAPQIERIENKLDAFAAESRQDRRTLAETQAQHTVRLDVLERRSDGHNGVNKDAAAADLAAAQDAGNSKGNNGGRLTVKEFLLLAAGVSLLSGGVGAGLTKLLELIK